MSLPESMSRIVIVGANSRLDQAIDVLYSMGTVHLIDHTVDADEGFTLGTPRPYSPKAAERLLKVRGMEKDLGINKHTKTQQILESEIRSQISSDSVESIEDEVKAVIDKRNDLNQRITELNAKKKNLELLARLPIDIDQYSGYKSIVAMIGTVESDPTAAVADMGELFVSMDKKNGNVVALFVKNEDRTKAQNILSEHGFTEITVPEGSGTVASNLAIVTGELEVVAKEIEAVEKETEVLFEKHKHFLRACDEELTVDSEKGTLPVRIASTKYTFVMDAWVPTYEAGDIKNTIESKVGKVYVSIEENRGRTVEESEKQEERFQTVPTKMKHGKVTKLFEYPTLMMSVPKYNEVDPTVLISIFLPLFFGFMVGDCGYAIPFIILGAYGLKFAKNPDWRAIATVLFFGGIWAFIFGFFFFGEALGMHFVGPQGESVTYTWAYLLHLDNLEHFFESFLIGGHGVGKIDPDYVGLLLRLSVYVGIVHLAIGYLVGLYNKSVQHGFKHGFLEKGGPLLIFIGVVIVGYAFGWALIMDGYSIGEMFSHTNVLVEMIVGIVFIAAGAALVKKSEGAMSILIETVDAFGNILSYTRLVAIGMSKAGMALAFNYIALGMIAGINPDPAQAGEVSVIMVIIGLLIFAFLHLMIWTLAILSGGLHALRLQLVEFMIKFYEGEGTMFTPLRFKHVKTISDISTKEA